MYHKIYEQPQIHILYYDASVFFDDVDDESLIEEMEIQRDLYRETKRGVERKIDDVGKTIKKITDPLTDGSDEDDR